MIKSRNETIKEGRMPTDFQCDLGIAVEDVFVLENYWNIPKRFCDCDEKFDDLIVKLSKYEENKPELEKLMNFMINIKENVKKGKGLYISGINGIGKTTIICYLIWKTNGFHFSSTRLINLIKKSWKDEMLASFLELVVKRSPTLAIDDFDVVDYKKQNDDAFYYKTILLDRYDDMKSVFISNNFDLEHSFGDDLSIKSRFSEYTQVNLVSKDLREL